MPISNPAGGMPISNPAAAWMTAPTAVLTVQVTCICSTGATYELSCQRHPCSYSLVAQLCEFQALSAGKAGPRVINTTMRTFA
jgi:hypothetical protein